MAASATSSLSRSLFGALDRAVALGSRPVCGASGAAFRVGFGLLGVAAVARFAGKGWISDLYVEPAHHFTYSGFWWVQPPPSWGIHALFALLALASLGVAAGFKYRLSIVAFFLLFTYIELIDKTTYLNHYYLVSLLAFLMIFMPLDRRWSVDAWRDERLRAEPFPAWCVWTLRAQVGIVYAFGGLAKLNPDWLLRAQPMRIWLFNSSHLPLVGELLRETWVAYAMSCGGLLFDLTIVGWMLWARSRPIAYAALCAFHVATWLLFPIGMFAWIMICASLIFFPPDWPVALLRRAGFRLSPTAPRPRCGPPRRTTLARLGAAALALFALVQIAMPLRHWAYPGNVRWNEDGYRFSWRVMLTEKTGITRFRVEDVNSGREWLAYPEDYLTPLQAERMAHQPDMILSLARLIADDYARRGIETQVRADAFVAFNGREAARLVDPDVDLAQEPAGIYPKRWTLPPPED